MSGSPAQYPYDTVVYVTATIGNEVFQGSGVLIAPNEVLTASHVVYSSDHGAASDIIVTPDYAPGRAPYGSSEAVSDHYNPIVDPGGLISPYWSQFDYAVLHLASPFTGIGTMQVTANFPGGYANVTGYPAMANGRQVTASELLTTDQYYSLYDGYPLGEGSSGGPVWVSGANGTADVVGLVSSGTANFGYFTELTSAAVQTIDAWVAQDEAACFAAGSRIATPHGEVPVEHLRPGDLVCSRFAGATPVVWVGHRRLACRQHPNPERVRPVCVAAHAFGPGRPRRALRLSPDHAVFVGGALIPVRYLVNGATIVQQQPEEITYWHVELGAHDVLWAEGLPVESYLDTGNRAVFTGNAGAVPLYPDFARTVWRTQGCAPLVTKGARVVGARRRLLARACRRGHVLTSDPDLRLLDADGHPVEARTSGRRWHVRLSGDARVARIVSRTWTPAHTRPPETDARRLGVAVSRLWLDGREVDPASPALACGWHAAEPGWRWTAGDAEIPVAGCHELGFEVVMTGSYWRAPTSAGVASTGGLKSVNTPRPDAFRLGVDATLA